jgi:hypothetical protein
MPDTGVLLTVSPCGTGAIGKVCSAAIVAGLCRSALLPGIAGRVPPAEVAPRLYASCVYKQVSAGEALQGPLHQIHEAGRAALNLADESATPLHRCQ